MAAGEIHHLRHFGFRHFVRKDADDREPLFVDGQHDIKGLRVIEAEEAFQHMHDEFHRGVIVIEQHDLIHRGALRAGFGLGQKPRIIARPIGLVRHGMGKFGHGRCLMQKDSVGWVHGAI